MLYNTYHRELLQLLNNKKGNVSMSKYLLLTVALIATNNLKSFSSAAETASPVTPVRSVETTPARPESRRGCFSGLFSPFRGNSQVSPVGRGAGSATVAGEASPVAPTRQGSPVSPVTMSAGPADLVEGPIKELQKKVKNMAAFAAWRAEYESGTPMLDGTPAAGASAILAPRPSRGK